MVSENIIKNTIISTQIQPEKTFLVCRECYLENILQVHYSYLHKF